MNVTLYSVILPLAEPNIPQYLFNFCMVPYDNWHVLNFYVAKEGLPRAYAEHGPLQHPSTFVCESAMFGFPSERITLIIMTWETCEGCSHHLCWHLYMGSWDMNQVPLKCLSHLLSQWAVGSIPQSHTNALCTLHTHSWFRAPQDPWPYFSHGSDSKWSVISPLH
jgi:hypothetical protein